MLPNNRLPNSRIFLESSDLGNTITEIIVDEFDFMVVVYDNICKEPLGLYFTNEQQEELRVFLNEHKQKP
tara:strand:+ start:419 stop:628 length:210 start_codon:yes stop_codon:yes gene_type:complete